MKLTSGSVLKNFVYTTGGRLSSAKRTHYDSLLGTLSVEETYQYDLAGRPIRRDVSVSPNPSESFFLTQSYDDLGAVAGVTYPCRKAASACNAADRTPPTVVYEHVNGHFTGVTGWASVTHQPNGMLGTVTHSLTGGSLTETWTPDATAIGRVASITVRQGTTTRWSSGTYSYDESGNITKIGDTSYRYDTFGRLIGTERVLAGDGTESTTRAYDRWGNHLYSTAFGCQDLGQYQRCHMSGAVLNEVDGTTNHYKHEQHDAAGNVTSTAGRTFTYDAFNMPAHAVVNGREYRYLYTAEDERLAIVERVNATNRITWTLRGFGNELLSVWTDGSWSSDQIWRGAQLLGADTPAGRRHFALDHLGSVRAIFDNDGVLLGTQAFTPFGIGGTSDGGPLQFTGHERDGALYGSGDVNLPDYMHARSMDPIAGRFLSVDPVMATCCSLTAGTDTRM